jgi:hypothetical protein
MANDYTFANLDGTFQHETVASTTELGGAIDAAIADEANNRNAAISAAVLVETDNRVAAVTLANAPAVTTVTPATGATVTMSAGVRALLVSPSGTIATLTVKLPPTPAANQIVDIGFTQIVTTLTVQDSAAGAVDTTAGAVGVPLQYRYVGSSWVKWTEVGSAIAAAVLTETNARTG